MGRLAIIPLILAAASPLALAQTIPIGQGCNLARNRIAPSSHQFLSDCVPNGYCDPTTSTCMTRKCRKDEFPFKWPVNDTLPDMCGGGTFCPDEGDQCLPQIQPGQNCQLNRDDQCAPPSNSGELASVWNSNGAICLRFVCYWQNVTLGQPCVIDNVAYTGFRTDGSEFYNIISRDNCQSTDANQLYCDGTALVCKQAQDLGAQCGSDKECKSHNCGTDNTCHLPAGTVIKIKLWEYIITGAGIVGFILAILLTLFLIHRRSRAIKQREIREYFHEQTTYRSSIIALHTAARDRTSSIYSRSESRFSQYDEHGQMIYRDDDSQRHLLDADKRRQSGLRTSTIAHDDDSDDETHEGRRLMGGSSSHGAGPSGLGAGPSRLSLADDTPRQSFDYGQSSGQAYSAVPMRQSVDLPMGAGQPKRGDFKDPWGNN